MKEVKCPNCETVVEVSHNAEKVICPNCLANHQKQYIMIESDSTKNFRYLGEGFFESNN